eukprot:jgi/Bigna1/68868/fgenesh1_pg.7_\
MGQNQIGCLSNRWESENLRVHIEEGWLEQMECDRNNDEKKRRAQSQRTLLRSSWVANNAFSALSIPERGSSAESKFLQIFDISISENRKRLCNTEYMRNVFLQTRQFEDKSAERDLENQEIASACSAAYGRIYKYSKPTVLPPAAFKSLLRIRIIHNTAPYKEIQLLPLTPAAKDGRYRWALGELWDTYQSDGSFQKANHRQLLRGYFAVFERHGRRLIAEGIAMGSAFVAREMGFFKTEEIEKYGKWLQVILREKQKATIEASYQRYLKHKVIYSPPTCSS